MTDNARQLALLTLRSIQQGAFADVALDRSLHRADLAESDRRFVTELVYGIVRRTRTLDALINQLARKPADEQPPLLRLILHLGLYQLRYLAQIPPSAAVNTSVDLAKTNGFSGLAGLVNGLLRNYLRSAESGDPLILPNDPIDRLGILHSYPDWIVQTWVAQFGAETAERLCEWFNRPPRLDLRINPLRSSIEQVEAAFAAIDIPVQRLPHLPQGLRVVGNTGAIAQLPGFSEGWWMVQDASAQLVTHLLDPQPEEVIVDACAAPGGKTAHMAELMHDRGTIWACDRTASRLKKLKANAERLGLHSIKLYEADSRQIDRFEGQVDRVLVDAPCSGLGTLHRHADARWRQTPESVIELAQLQQELLEQAVTWVKPNGILVYSTCTLHEAENEAIVEAFLQRHPNWTLEPPPANNPAATFANSQGWVRVLPPDRNMDGFFMARLLRLKG